MKLTIRVISAAASLALVAAACASDGGETAATALPTAADAPTTTAAPTTTVASATTTTTTTTTVPVGVANSTELPGDLPLVTAAWKTDWTRTTVDFAELKIGIFATDPRDSIAPIDEPKFEGVDAGAEWLGDREPGVAVEFDGGAKFYPLAVMTLHEVINDDLDGVPVAVTYCPLCNTGIVFERRIDGTEYRFGVSGLLRNSDLIMWDDVTESLWQQITGDSIVGTMAGTALTPVPSAIVSFSQYAESFPDGQVLSRDTGFGYPYGVNPYELYSSRGRPFGFFDGELDDRYPALERVVGVSVDDAGKAYPFSEISSSGVVNDEVAGVPVVVMWGGSTADALDSSQIAQGQAVGTGVAYSPIVDGQKLTFVSVSDSVYQDEQTGSTWNILGKATDGPLVGSSLSLLNHRNEFWFAWTAFFPEAEVYTG